MFLSRNDSNNNLLRIKVIVARSETGHSNQRRPCWSRATGAGIGYTFGNVPGAMAGFVAGLGYEYILVPYLIQPLIYDTTGINPYARTRQLAPLVQGGQ